MSTPTRVRGMTDRRPRGPLVTVALALVLQAGLAHAQDDEPNPDHEESGRVFLRAAAAYGNGEYETAAELFEQAYELHPEPALLLNLGLARERAGMVFAAIDAYEQFLAERPDAEERPDVERSLETLRRQLALEEQIAQRENDETPATSGGISPAPWVVAGGGVLTLITGAILGGIAQGRYDEALAASHADVLNLEAEANDLALGANILFGVGGTLTLVGVVWGIIDVATQSGGGSTEEDVALTFGGRRF